MMKIDILIDSANRHRNGLSNISFEIPALKLQRQVDISFGDLYEHCGIPDPVSLDLLIFGSVCYAIDKTVSRLGAPDCWTRELELSLPVSDPDLWTNAAGELETTLSFLSGDIWRLSFTGLTASLFKRPFRKRRRRWSGKGFIKRADAACLFSGGLDSLTGAIDLIASDAAKHLLLIGHYDAPGPASTQNRLFDVIRPSYPGRADLLQIRVSHKPDAAEEPSQRTRSLVFIALGMYAARAFGPDVPLYAPENGLIAINIPLTPSRSGSCSTRTMHPFFLESLRSALSFLGMTNPLINPYELKTKGECIAECLNGGLLRSLIDDSVSCAHPGRKQNWVRRDAGNCGYCVPCIFRRAALHRAGMDIGEKYGIDFCSGELSADDQLESANDLRAVTDFLRKKKDVERISREILRAAPVDQVKERAEMAVRGFDEVRALIRDKGRSSVRAASGISKK